MLKMKADFHFQGKFNIDVKIKNKKGEIKWFNLPHYALDAVIFAGDDSKDYEILDCKGMDLPKHLDVDELNTFLLIMNKYSLNNLNDLMAFCKMNNIIHPKDENISHAINALCKLYCINLKL